MTAAMPDEREDERSTRATYDRDLNCRGAWNRRVGAVAAGLEQRQVGWLD